MQVIERGKQMHHTLAEFERLQKHRFEGGFIVRTDSQIADRQLDGVLLEAIDLRPRIDGKELAVHAQMRMSACLRPLREVRVNALAVHHERCKQAYMLAFEIPHDLRDD